MQGEDVYTALDFSLTGGKASDSSQNVATVQCPRWHRIAIGAGGALCTVLTGVMVAVGIWAFQCSSQRRSTSTTPNQQDMVSLPDRCHCSEAQITTTATLPPVSDVCSEDWVFFRGMCYFISNEYLDWNSSREDCLSMESQLLVIDDHKEMDFITNITRNKNFLWIGLQVKTLGGEWTWVNGFVLNQHMFSVHSAPEETSCGTAKRGSLNSESCRSKLNWICEKTAGMP